jgi:hypothetical protein
VILSVNAYMLSDGDFVGDCIYAKWMMTMWWWLLIELWLDWLCERKCLIMQLLVNVYVRWFCIIESLLVCPCIIVILSHMRNVKGGVLLHRWVVRGGVLLHQMFLLASWGDYLCCWWQYRMHLEESITLHAFE